MLASRILNLTFLMGSSQSGPSREPHWKPCKEEERQLNTSELSALQPRCSRSYALALEYGLQNLLLFPEILDQGAQAQNLQRDEVHASKSCQAENKSAVSVARLPAA